MVSLVDRDVFEHVDTVAGPLAFVDQAIDQIAEVAFVLGGFGEALAGELRGLGLGVVARAEEFDEFVGVEGRGE